MTLIKPNDNYIQFTKYGGVNKGIVKDVKQRMTWDCVNNVVYSKTFIITNNNILLELDGTDGRIYKVEKEITETDCINMGKVLEKSKK